MVFAAQKSAAFHTSSNLWATQCIEIHRNAYSLQKCSVPKLDAFHEAVKHCKITICACFQVGFRLDLQHQCGQSSTIKKRWHVSSMFKLRQSVTAEDVSVQRLCLQVGVGNTSKRSELFSTVSEPSQAACEHSKSSGGTEVRSRGRTSSAELHHHLSCAVRACALGACSICQLVPVEQAAVQVDSINQPAVSVCSDKPSQLSDGCGLLSNSRLQPACGSSSSTSRRAGGWTSGV